MHTEYVIASYMGERIDHMPEYERDRAFFLRNHIAQLEHLDHELDGITIVHNDCGHPAEAYLDQIPARIQGARVRIMRRENTGFSYGAYVHAVQQSPEATHFVLMEDDYVFANHDFDTWLLERLPEGMLAGAVWPWSWEDHPKLPMAAVFLGMVHAHALRAAIANGWHGRLICSNDATYQGGYYGQVALSQALVLAGFEVKDWLEERATAFWNSSLQRVDMFTESSVLHSVVVPLQAITLPVPVVTFGRAWRNPQPELRCHITHRGKFAGRLQPE